jgi:hypothetical protein
MSAVGFEIPSESLFTYCSEHVPQIIEGFNGEIPEFIHCAVWYENGCLPNQGRCDDSFKSKDGLISWFRTKQREFEGDNFAFTAIVKSIYYSIKKGWIAVEVTISSDTVLCFMRNDENLSTFALKRTILNNPKSGHTTIRLKERLCIIGCVPYSYSF